MENAAIEQVKTPDFQMLLESLQKETNRGTELTGRLAYLGGQIKPIELKSEKINPMEKEPNGIIDLLWQQIWRLRNQNDELQVVSDHLHSLVGS